MSGDTSTVAHPTADELASYALAHDSDVVGAHLAECPSCARYVREIAMAREALAALPEADVPEDVERRILSHQDERQPPPGMWGRFGEWYRSPFLIGLSVVLASIFFLVFFLFVLH